MKHVVSLLQTNAPKSIFSALEVTHPSHRSPELRSKSFCYAKISGVELREVADDYYPVRGEIDDGLGGVLRAALRLF